MARGVGYCLNTECEEYHKGVFLFNHGPKFNCPRCHIEGRHVIEKAVVKNSVDPAFWQVRVEFNYCPKKDDYTGLAVVQDNSMPEKSNVYTLRSPLIKTKDRALTVAEGVLSTLMRSGYEAFTENSLGRVPPFEINFDNPREQVLKRLNEFESILKSSRLVDVN